MDGKSPPILCCIGDCIGGQPTQFVMERAFSALELDWRAITVQVGGDDIHNAMAGIQAMRFRAVRFLGNYRHSLVGSVFSDFAHLKFIGAVTSASFANSKICAWDNLGYGILSELQRSDDSNDSQVWLVGDSPLTRSCSMAIGSESFQDAPESVRRDSGSHRICRWYGAPEAYQAQELTSQQAPAEPRRMEQFELAEVQTHLAECTERASLVVAGDVLPMLQNELTKAACDNITIASDDAGEGLLKSMEFNGQIIGQSDQNIASEAYDFVRWTEQNIDLSIIRDAYEEYCDF